MSAARRALAVVLLAALAAAAIGCSAPDPDRLVTETVGEGAQATTIVRPAGDGPHPVVLFLHGWGATRVREYRPWVEHLARAGNAVLYPRYQDSVLDPPPQALGNVLAGVRLALERIDAGPGTLVAAGHSAGGALAADYAALAPVAGLPVPRAVFAAYPGRFLPGVPAALPEIPPARIPPGTRILALAGARDVVVGDAAARALVEGATRVPRARRRLEVVDAPGASDHAAPLRADAPARREIWRRLDRLIARARA